MQLDSNRESPSLTATADDTSVHRSMLEEGIHDASSLFLGDDAAKPSATRQSIEHGAAEVVKAVPLFMLGTRNAYAATRYCTVWIR